MISWRKVLSVGLVCCMTLLSLGDVAAFGATAAPEPAQVKKQVRLLGVGAEVKLRLADGRKLHGSISAVEGEAFLLASGRAASPKRVSYDQVGELKLAKLTYKAAGKPDPAEARRVVLGLGVGNHIMVKTAAGKEYHGFIMAIEEAGFTVTPDLEAAPVQIAYTNVLQVGPNMTRGEKIATIAIVAGLTLLVLYLIGRTQTD